MKVKGRRKGIKGKSRVGIDCALGRSLIAQVGLGILCGLLFG